MQRRSYLLTLTALLFQSVQTMASEKMLPFRSGDWAKLLTQYKGQPLIVHFWGVTCGPCIEELPQWGEFVKRHPQQAVVFIQVDQTPLRVSQRWLNDANLGEANNRMVSETFDEYARYEIDPKWMGELPATFLIDRHGRRLRWSGSTDFARLQGWVKAQADR